MAKGEWFAMDDTVLRRTWAEIDLDALAHNYHQARLRTGPNVKYLGVVKADAYGHGAVQVARKLEQLGAEYLAVSSLDEARELRHAGVEAPILILGHTPPSMVPQLIEYRITQAVSAQAKAEEYSAAAVACGGTLKVHIKVDTGMSRLGFLVRGDHFQGGVEAIAKSCDLPNLDPEGIFTHFAVSDEGQAGDAFTMRQFGCFKEMIESLLREGISFAVRHCANSAAVFDYPLSHLDMVRAGIVIYGLYPSAALRNRPQLTPVLALKSVVSHVKEVKPGATISYGRKFTAGQAMKVATIPVGYADGYPRILSAQGAQVLIGGKRCPILGRICMDQLMADVSALPEVKVGDVVTLIGRDGAEEITADELAALEGSINYEVVCGLSKRVPRVYLKNGQVDSIYNALLGEEAR